MIGYALAILAGGTAGPIFPKEILKLEKGQIMQWTLTPDKYLNEEEVKRLVRICTNAAELAEKRGYWLAVRDWMIIDLTLNTGLRIHLSR